MRLDWVGRFVGFRITSFEVWWGDVMGGIDENGMLELKMVGGKILTEFSISFQRILFEII